MKKIKTLLLTGLFVSASVSASAAQLYEMDLAGMPLDTPLAKADTWWSNGWGSTVETQIDQSGPDGALAVTRTTTGNVYGGVLRALTEAFAEPLPAGATNADVTVSFWVKGSSTGSMGVMGFALIGFLDGADGFESASQSSYLSIPVTSEWTQHTFTLADMIITPGREDALLDITTIDALQVFPHFRSDIETGWPIGDDNAEWSVSLTGLTIAAASGETWAGFPVLNGYVETGNFMGWLFYNGEPTVYSWTLGGWIYLPEENVSDFGAWAYIFP